MLRKTKTPTDIKNIQILSSNCFLGVIDILETVNQEYKKMLNSSQEEELKRVYEMGYQKEFGWCIELIDSLKRIQQCTDIELKEMKQILKKSKKQWG